MKKPVMKIGLKTKLFLTWIAVELAVLPLAIPATAQIVERISFSIPPRVAAVEFKADPGISRYIVSSNAPFAIISEGMVGDVNIDVTVSGQLITTPFGEKAQSPGPLNSCASIVGVAPRIIYTADRKTAAKRGKIIEQSIIFEIAYDGVAKPAISFEAFAKDGKVPMPKAKQCNDKKS